MLKGWHMLSYRSADGLPVFALQSSCLSRVYSCIIQAALPWPLRCATHILHSSPVSLLLVTQLALVWFCEASPSRASQRRFQVDSHATVCSAAHLLTLNVCSGSLALCPQF